MANAEIFIVSYQFGFITCQRGVDERIELDTLGQCSSLGRTGRTACSSLGAAPQLA
jgi:hypothetical protein